MSVSVGKTDSLILRFDNVQFIESMSTILKGDNLVIENKYLMYKIEEIFYENKFNSFESYCEEYEVNVVGEITSNLLVNYFYERGVGTKKVANVLQQLQDLGQVTIASYRKPASKYIGSEKISVVFGEKTFSSFLDYCEKQQKYIISDLTSQVLEGFSIQKGVGLKKVNKVLERLDIYSEEAHQNNFNQPFSCGLIFQQIKNRKVVDICQILDLTYKGPSALTIEEMEGKMLDQLESLIPSEILIPLMKELQKINPPTLIFSGVEAYLTKESYRDWEILKLRNETGATLQSVADQLGITRERVRQLINKAAGKLDVYFTQAQLIKTLKLYAHNSFNISFAEVSNLVGSEYDFILKILAAHSKIIYYFEKFERFYFEDIKDKKEFFKNWINELPDFFNYHHFQNKLDSLLTELNLEPFQDQELEFLLTRYGYKRYGEVFSKTGLTMVKAAEYLFENYFKEPFKLNEQGVKKFQKYAKKYLDFDCFEGNIRNLDARFRDSDQIIAVNSYTYIWFNGSFDTEILAEINHYIDEVLSQQSVVNATQIFERFKERVLPFGVLGSYHLYHIIKYYLSDKYQIGRGNTLEIYRDGASMITAEESLIEFIEKKGGIAKKEEIAEALKWEIYRIEQRVSESDELVMWNGDCVRILREINITDSELTELKGVLFDLLADNYTTGELILKELKANEKLLPLLKREDFERCINLVAYCKKIAKLKGHLSFLSYAGSPYENIYDVIVEKYRYTLSRIELKEFLNRLGYSEQMTGTVVKKLLEDGLFVEISIEEFYNAKTFKISPLIIDQVIEYLKEKMGTEKYLSLSELRDYENHLPKIQFSWTPQLIKTIVVGRGYKQIEKTHPDYRYEKVIIARVDSEVDTFEELLLYILKYEYKGEMVESHVYTYLENRGIVKKQDRPENKTFSQRILKAGLVKFTDSGVILK